MISLPKKDFNLDLPLKSNHKLMTQSQFQALGIQLDSFSLDSYNSIYFANNIPSPSNILSLYLRGHQNQLQYAIQMISLSCPFLKKISLGFYQYQTELNNSGMFKPLYEMDSLQSLQLSGINMVNICQIIDNIKSLKIVKLYADSSEGLSEFIQCSQRLEQVHLKYIFKLQYKDQKEEERERLDNEVMIQLSSMKNLTSLAIQRDMKGISNSITSTFPMFSKNFKSLCIESDDNTLFQDPEYFINTINQLSQLQSLTLDYPSISGKTFELLRSNLQKVQLYGVKFKQQQLTTFCSNNNQIKQLSINKITDSSILCMSKLSLTSFQSSERSLTKIAMEYLIASQPKLLNLNMSYYKISDRQLKLLSESLVELEEISLGGLSLSNKGFMYLKKMKKLRSFELNYAKITIKLFLEVVINLKRIKYHEYKRSIFSQKLYSMEGKSSKKTFENFRQGVGIWFKFI